MKLAPQNISVCSKDEIKQRGSNAIVFGVVLVVVVEVESFHLPDQFRHPLHITVMEEVVKRVIQNIPDNGSAVERVHTALRGQYKKENLQ